VPCEKCMGGEPLGRLYHLALSLALLAGARRLASATAVTCHELSGNCGQIHPAQLRQGGEMGVYFRRARNIGKMAHRERCAFLVIQPDYSSSFCVFVFSRQAAPHCPELAWPVPVGSGISHDESIPGSSKLRQVSRSASGPSYGLPRLDGPSFGCSHAQLLIDRAVGGTCLF